MRIWTKAEIQKEVMRLIAEQLDIGENEIEQDTELVDLGFDSLDAVEFCVAMEVSFGIEIADAELWGGNFEGMTANEVVDYIVDSQGTRV